ncbi:MAG: hypothetical protein HY072_03920 [Deltaproteobacteria bacterium]|nr:hypothetical protein [Deltaproteobacteria bacterium]
MIKLLTIPLFVLLLTLNSFATIPTPPKIFSEIYFRSNTVYVRLQNKEQVPLLLTLKAGALSTMEIRPKTVQLAPNVVTTVPLETAMRLGRQVLHITSQAVFGHSQLSVQAISILQPVEVSQQIVKKLSFEEAFLMKRQKLQGKSQLSKIDLGGGLIDQQPIGSLFFSSAPLNNNTQIQTFQFRSPFDYAQMAPKQLPNMSLPQKGNAFTPRDPNGDPNGDPFDVNNHDNIEDNPTENPAPYIDAMLTIKGNLSLKMDAATYKAAWGWVVKAWQMQAGIWRFLGWNYISGDGNWDIQVDSSQVDNTLPIWVEYQTKNRFISIQDQAGNPYTWGDAWNLKGVFTNIGSRVADLTSNGDMPGVDRIYVGATLVWVKFFNNGINALRDSVIPITYPNSLASGKCKYDDGAGPYAWSCSYFDDGSVYVIPAHAADYSTTQHELGHSINSFYWGGKMPPDSSGSHNIWNCYTKGLALSEGFANFLTYWVQFDRNETNPTAPYYNMNLEALPDAVCKGPTNEMRIAATFWDMYDYWNDGPDTTKAFDSLLYTDPATSVTVYLQNKKDKMEDYLEVVKAGQSDYWQKEFEKLFRLNTIVP